MRHKDQTSPNPAFGPHTYWEKYVKERNSYAAEPLAAAGKWFKGKHAITHTSVGSKFVGISLNVTHS